MTEQEALLGAIKGVSEKVDAVSGKIDKVDEKVELVRTKGPLRCDQGDRLTDKVRELEKDKLIREHDEAIPPAPKKTSSLTLKGPGGWSLDANGTDVAKIVVMGIIVLLLIWDRLSDINRKKVVDINERGSEAVAHVESSLDEGTRQ